MTPEQFELARAVEQHPLWKTVHEGLLVRFEWSPDPDYPGQERIDLDSWATIGGLLGILQATGEVQVEFLSDKTVVQWPGYQDWGPEPGTQLAKALLHRWDNELRHLWDADEGLDGVEEDA